MCVCMNVKVCQSPFIPTLLALVLQGARTDLQFTFSVKVLPLLERFFVHKESVAFVESIFFFFSSCYHFLFLSLSITIRSFVLDMTLLY